MYFIKRTCMYIIIVLFLVSIYNDLTAGTRSNTKEVPIQTFTHPYELNLSAIFAEIQPGETLLPKVEQLNANLPTNLDISQIINDFEQLNPKVDPNKLNTNTSYFFPIYKNN